MRPVHTSLLFAIILGACASVPPEAQAPPSPGETERLLRAQADAWDKAIVRKDRTAIEANVAPDFFHIDGNGDVQERAAFMKDLVDPDLTIDPYTVEGLNVHLYGPSTALLSGSTHMTGTFKGKPFQSNYRYIDTYVRRDGRWQVVAVQITRLPQP